MPETVTSRPHAQRLLRNLEEVRFDLNAAVQELGPERYEWEPRPGMRTCKNLLQEIGTMETLCRNLASNGASLSWETVWNELERDSAEAMLAALEGVRAETVAFLEGVTEEGIQTPVPLPESWRQYFDNAVAIEPEELVRWIARNEYYHAGQLYTYGCLLTGK